MDTHSPEKDGETAKGEIFFSFVIPTYNRADLVVQSIRSALDWLDTCQDGEIIVVDDASRDETVARLQSALATEINAGLLRLLPQTRNGGAIRSKNVGGRAARGRWIIFLDSDDVMKPSEASAMRAAFTEFSASPAIFFRCEDIRTGERIGPPQTEPTMLSLHDYLNRGMLAECLPVLRKDVFDRFPYDESLDGWEGITYARIMRAMGSFVISPIIARRYRAEGDDRLSSSKGLKRRSRALARGHWLLLRDFSPLLTPGRQLRHVAKAGYHYFRSLI